MSSNTYVIPLNLSLYGHGDMTIRAHNPVGWSKLHPIQSGTVSQQYIGLILIALTLNLLNAF